MPAPELDVLLLLQLLMNALGQAAGDESGPWAPAICVRKTLPGPGFGLMQQTIRDIQEVNQ